MFLWDGGMMFYALATLEFILQSRVASAKA